MFSDKITNKQDGIVKLYKKDFYFSFFWIHGLGISIIWLISFHFILQINITLKIKIL